MISRCYETTTYAQSGEPLEANTAVVGVLVAVSIVLAIILVKYFFWFFS